MSIITRLRRYLADAPTRIYECRNCGTNLPAEKDRCTVCDSSDIVTFLLS